MGWAAVEHNIAFYENDSHIADHNPIWAQTKLEEVVRIFERVVLKKNLGKTKAMVCTPGLIWGQQGTAAYKRRWTGEQDTFLELKKTRVSCEDCRGWRWQCHHYATTWRYHT